MAVSILRYVHGRTVFGGRQDAESHMSWKNGMSRAQDAHE